jgi:hypothetical protein
MAAARPGELDAHQEGERRPRDATKQRRFR